MIVLDGTRMTDRAALHAELKRAVALPDYYGDNLDALSDSLGERRERELVVIENSVEFLEACEGYALALLCMFGDHGMQVLLA